MDWGSCKKIYGISCLHRCLRSLSVVYYITKHIACVKSSCHVENEMLANGACNYRSISVQGKLTHSHVSLGGTRFSDTRYSDTRFSDTRY